MNIEEIEFTIAIMFAHWREPPCERGRIRLKEFGYGPDDKITLKELKTKVITELDWSDMYWLVDKLCFEYGPKYDWDEILGQHFPRNIGQYCELIKALQDKWDELVEIER